MQAKATPVAERVIHERDLQVIPQHGVSSAARSQALDLLGRGRVDSGRIPRETAGFGDLGDLLATMGGRGRRQAPMHAVFVPDEL
jgi:hypothetical protein